MIDLELTRRETEYKIGAFCADGKSAKDRNEQGAAGG